MIDGDRLVAGSVRLTNLVLLADEVDRARAVLVRVVDEGAADAAILLLRSGEIAAIHSDGAIPSVETLGALLSANYAAAREIARVLGETGLESQYQQGQQRHVVTNAVGDGWLLAVVFRAAASLGLIRVLARGASQELHPLYEQARVRAARGDGASATPPTFRVAASEALDKLFGDT